MNLVLDIGNTRLKAGLFGPEGLAEQAFWTAWTLGELSGFAREKQVERVILSSVAAPDAALTAFFAQNFTFIEL
ncbi:MAG: hypothetical protein ACK4Q5_20260, partial [Saprospiraceae bacterium]